MSINRKMAFLALTLGLCMVLLAGGAGADSQLVHVDLLDWVNNDGISTDKWPGDQNFDGGGWGFPAEELPDGDFTVQWDEQTSVTFAGLYKEDGWGNNIEAVGQTIELPAGSYRGAWILAANHHGSTEGAPIIFEYSDGTTSEGEIYAGDWCGNPVANERMVIKPSHRHDPNGDTGPSCGMWLLPMYELDPEKTLVRLTLPDENRFHIFGITLVRE